METSTRCDRAPTAQRYASQIQFVTDRPGHDYRHAIDGTHLETMLGWRPTHTPHDGLSATVQWYLANESWWRRILPGAYRTERLGLSGAS